MVEEMLGIGIDRSANFLYMFVLHQPVIRHGGKTRGAKLFWQQRYKVVVIVFIRLSFLSLIVLCRCRL